MNHLADIFEVPRPLLCQLTQLSLLLRLPTWLLIHHGATASDQVTAITQENATAVATATTVTGENEDETALAQGLLLRNYSVSLCTD
jgi:hypothetical protein